jgi:TrmH family RNA methyltransferase
MATTAAPPITSRHHPGIRELRFLHRRRERDRSGRFVAEGEDLLEAGDAAGWQPVHRFRAAGTDLSGSPVDPEVLAWASTLGSGTRAIGVYEQRWATPAGPLCVYLHEVADPGNVGAIVRSALAFGASSVALGPGCADPYGPKAVRASMGAIFAMPLARAVTLDQLPGRTLALAAHGGEPLAGAPAAPTPTTILLGAERNGLPAELLAQCDEVCHIPIAPTSESLNVAMAATVALYELTTRPRPRMAAETEAAT